MCWTTSAANFINYSDNVYDEVRSNPFGYDIFYFKNDRISGLYLSPVSSALFSGYATIQNIDANFNLSIRFVSGDIPIDLAGAYIYYSTGLFSGIYTSGSGIGGAYFWSGCGISLRILTGYSPILTGISTYDSYNKEFRYHLPNHYEWISPTGYVAICPYDSFDRELINRGMDLSTGILPISNILTIQSSGLLGYLDIGGYLTLYNMYYPNNYYRNSVTVKNNKFWNIINDKDGEMIVSTEPN